MPAMCRLTTSPMAPSPLPTWCSWTGAIVITETITRLASASTPSPAVPCRPRVGAPETGPAAGAPGATGAISGPAGRVRSPRASAPAAAANPTAAIR